MCSVRLFRVEFSIRNQNMNLFTDNVAFSFQSNHQKVKMNEII